MKFQSILSPIMVLMLASPALADPIVKQLTDSNNVDTVYQVEKDDGSIDPAVGTHTDYVYEMLDGTVFHSPDKIKCKDVRPFSKKHPRIAAFQTFCTFVNPILAFLIMVR